MSHLPTSDRPCRAASFGSGMRGFSLVELMVAMTIGLFLVAATLAMYVNTRAAHDANQAVARMQENARYAMDQLSRDLRLAGHWGHSNDKGWITKTGVSASFTGDCGTGWYINLDRRVEGQNNGNPYSGTCIPSASKYQLGTDVLVLRYADPTPVATADLKANTSYIRADHSSGKLFIGTSEPAVSAIAQNYRLQSRAYFVSDFTNAGDPVPVPALKRVVLNAGPALQEEVVISGVEDLQVQFGLDTNGDGSVNRYLDPNNVGVTQWESVEAVRIWLLMRAEETETGYQADTATYKLPGGDFTPADDRFRRLLVSRIIRLRN